MSPAAQVRDIGAVFHGLFRSRGRGARGAVGEFALDVAAAAGRGDQRLRRLRLRRAPAAPVEAGGELDLFQDQLPDARALFRGRV